MTTRNGTSVRIGALPPNHIFVFGSNEAGRHGKGAARDAYEKFGAVYGQGVGHHGQSYAVPTKNETLKPLSITEISAHVRGFIDYAQTRPDLTFVVTRIGCGYAGYTDDQIAPLFIDAPRNCQLPIDWVRFLGFEDYIYWAEM